MDGEEESAMSGAAPPRFPMNYSGEISGPVKLFSRRTRRVSSQGILRMIAKISYAWVLMAACVTIHAVGLTLVLRWLKTRASQVEWRFLPATWMLIQVAGWTLFLHALEISLWAVFYYWQQCLPDFNSAVYFSAMTYTTTGYGDVVLSHAWRLVGAVEALTGILMCGLSTGFFFAVVSRKML